MSPVVGEFHSFYWNLSDSNAPPVAPTGRGGYPAWQASVVAASLFGVIGAWLDHVVETLRWWWRIGPRIGRLTVPQRVVLLETLTTLESDRYQVARKAVYETAHSPGFNRPEMWIDYSRMLKANRGRTENVMRHVQAVERLRASSPSTIANADGDFLVTLAYQEYRIAPWRIR